jgi:hypothetical protein
MDPYKYKNYIGDVSLHYGGIFIDPSTWHDGYADCLRVTDLDSGCGFDGAVLVEKITVYGLDDKKMIDTARGCCGTEYLRGDGNNRKLQVIYDMAEYGYCDPDEDYRRPSTFIIQCDPEYPMTYDGWTADVRLAADDNLLAYLEREGWLRDYE